MAELFTEVYNCLPLAHCLGGKILVSIAFSRVMSETLGLCAAFTVDFKFAYRMFDYAGDAWRLVQL